MIRLLFIVATLTIVSCSRTDKSQLENGKQENLEVPVENTVPGIYGESLSDAGLTDLSELLSQLDDDSVFSGKVKIKIEDVCQMKGCWMTAKTPDGRELRITFRDYGFFVPKNAKGYTAVIEGEAVKKVIDEATRKHYADESGKSPAELDSIKGPGEELSFVADGVKIEK